MENPLHNDSSNSKDEAQDGDGAQRPEAELAGPALRRTLGVYDGLGLLIGGIIGSGIFASPGVCLERVGSPGMSLLVWCAAGALVVISSFSYMELAAMIPSAGGDFAYIQRAYGDDAAFCFAWYIFWVGKTGSQAIVSTIFGQYFTYLVAGGDLGDASTLSTVFAVILTVVLAAINCMGIRESSNLQNVLTVIKLVLIFGVFVGGMAYAMGSPDTLKDNLGGSAFDGTRKMGFFTGMVPALWAFDGWADLTFLAEEVIDPTRNIPKVMGGGLMLVTVAYILANVAYLAVLDADDLKDTDSIAIDFAHTTGDKGGGGAFLAGLMALGVALSTIGADNGSIMSGGRAYMAVARDGQAPEVFSSLNSRGAPWASLVAQCCWTCVLLLIPGSSFSALLDYFGPVSWMFYALTSSCVIKLRWSEPDTPRPFKIPLYPLSPVLTAVIAACIIVSSIAEEPLFSSLGLLFCGLALPVRWLVLYRQRVQAERDMALSPSPIVDDAMVVKSEI